MNSKLRILLAGLLVAASAWGFARLFLMRFQSGDVYPPYSSLRADPLGTRILYESFARFPELQAQRNFRPLEKLPREPATLFLPGAPIFGFFVMNFDTGRELQKFAARGGRVVVSMLAAPRAKWFDEEKTEDVEKGDDKSCTGTNGIPPEKAEKKKACPKCGKDSDDKGRSGKYDAGFKPARWDFEVENETNQFNLLSETAQVVSSNAPAFLPPQIAWKGTVYFSSLSNGWRVVYRRGERPVVIERRFAAGSVVVLADSYLLSNEAMWRNREPALLAWLAGKSPRVIFDETHFGLMEQPGIGTLVRRYRLYGFAAGFLLLAILFVWKESSALVPPWREPAAWGEREWIAGRDSMAALVNLLRRNVLQRDLLRVCAWLWEKSAASTRMGHDEALKKIRDVAGREAAKPAGARDPVQAYKKIGQLLKERK